MIEQGQDGRQCNEATPPEKILTAPKSQLSQPSDDSWLVVARNSRVNKDWEKLCARNLESGEICYEHLLKTPTLPKRGKIFPLRGKKYKGVWEYKIPSGDRVFYIPDIQKKKVEVYYADKHPKKDAPTP